MLTGILVKGGRKRKFHVISDAYNILSDPIERAKHDEDLNFYAETSYTWD